MADGAGIAAAPAVAPAWQPTRADVLGVLADPNRLRLVTQPIVDLARGHVVGYEVLSRFVAGTPDLWFAAAARTGLAPQLDALVVARALELRADLPPNTFLTVNIEPQDLLDPALLRTLLDAGDLSRFVLELTEHSRISEFAALAEPLGELRDRGAMFAADDVGSGYSGLQSLLAVRPEIVKIDRSLVDGIDTDPAKQAVVRMLGGLANRIDGWVLAEGIEREEELLELMRLEVPLAQGYLLGRPGPQLTTDLPISVVGLIRGQAALLAAVDELGSLMEVVPLLPAAGGGADPAALAIEIDAWGRPVAVVVDGARIRQPLTAHPGEAVHDTADRMVGRGGPLAPVVVVDGTGRAQGVVPPTRVLSRLADLRRP